MNAMKHLAEEQQAAVYKKLCESALRVYDSNGDVKSVDDWKKIYEAILKVTGTKVRKTAKGIRVTSEVLYENVSLDTSNIISRDCVARWINELDDGSENGRTIIRKIYLFIDAIRRRYKSKLA